MARVRSSQGIASAKKVACISERGRESDNSERVAAGRTGFPGGEDRSKHPKGGGG